MAERSLISDARSFHRGWLWWWRLLLIVNIAGPLLFLGHIEAVVVLASYLVSSVAIVVLHRRLGWVRLLGVGHLPWLGVIPWLLHRLLTTSPGDALATFLVVVIVVDTVCIVLDVADVGRWLAGERRPIVPG